MTQGISQKKAAELLKQYGLNELPSAKTEKRLANCPRSDSRAHVYLTHVLWSRLCFIGRLYRRNDSVVLGFVIIFITFINTEKPKNL